MAASLLIHTLQMKSIHLGIYILTILLSVRAPPPPNAGEMISILAGHSGAAVEAGTSSLSRAASSEVESVIATLRSTQKVSIRDFVALFHQHPQDTAVLNLAIDRLPKDLSVAEYRSMLGLELPLASRRRLAIDFLKTHPEELPMTLGFVDSHGLPFSDITVILSSVPKVSEETMIQLLSRESVTESDFLSKMNAVDQAITKMDRPTAKSINFLRSKMRIASPSTRGALEILEQRLMLKMEQNGDQILVNEIVPRNGAAFKIFLERKSQSQVSAMLQSRKAAATAKGIKPELSTSQVSSLIDKYPDQEALLRLVSEFTLPGDKLIITVLRQQKQKLGTMTPALEGMYAQLESQVWTNWVSKASQRELRSTFMQLSKKYKELTTTAEEKKALNAQLAQITKQHAVNHKAEIAAIEDRLKSVAPSAFKPKADRKTPAAAPIMSDEMESPFATFKIHDDGVDHIVQETSIGRVAAPGSSLNHPPAPAPAHADTLAAGHLVIQPSVGPPPQAHAPALAPAQPELASTNSVKDNAFSFLPETLD